MMPYQLFLICLDFLELQYNICKLNNEIKNTNRRLLHFEKKLKENNFTKTK